MAFKDSSKQWFETGDFPTQAQFAQVFEWLRWKDEPLAIADITNLQTILNSLIPGGASPLLAASLTLAADGVYVVPSGYAVFKMYMKSVAAVTLTIGSVSVADLYAGPFDLAANAATAMAIDIVAQAATTIKFYGINSSTTIKIYLLNI